MGPAATPGVRIADIAAPRRAASSAPDAHHSMKRPERVTPCAGANEQLLYFTSSSLTADDSRIVFLSDRAGHPNIFDREPRTGRERQRTANNEGYLKSYVYFDGAPYRGLGKASASLHAPSGTLFY